MFILMILATAMQVTNKRSAVQEALCWLARHQREDGSWGDRKDRCAHACEKVNVLPCTVEKVAPLLRALGDEDPGVRDSAEKDLRALGSAALPHLRNAAKNPDAEVRGRCAALARRLELTNEGLDAELTGLALLAFFGAGYSHLCRDELDGLTFGTVVKRALDWLLAREEELEASGVKDARADVVAALALSEAYRMTASQCLKDGAQKAIDRTVSTTFREPRGTLWKAMALKSAQWGDLAFPSGACEETLAALGSERGDLAIAARTIVPLFFRKERADLPLADLRALDPDALEIETLYFATLAAFKVDGPGGTLWKEWNERPRNRLVPIQHVNEGGCERGSWDGEGLRGRLRATALSALTLEVYYRFECPLYTSK